MTTATHRKLGLKDKYGLLTRGLGWDTGYVPMDKVFPLDSFEGIKIHDWDKWEDPFRVTMDSYWKYQAEKERKLYAIIDETRIKGAQSMQECVDFLGSLLPALDQAVAAAQAGEQPATPPAAASEPATEQAATAAAAANG